MHNNFYFLRQLTRALERVLSGAVVSECFSQSKDELVLRFETAGAPFLIRASLLPELSCLSFPENFQRAKKNSVDLFSGLVGRRVTRARQFQNERSFCLEFSDDHTLLFKMHGNRTNLVLFRESKVIELFRSKITADLNLNLDALDRDIDWSYDHFRKHAANPKTAYFTFGKVVWEFLQRRNFSSMDTSEQFKAIENVRRHLEDPRYYISLVNEKPVLSLLETGDIQRVLENPVEAANAYYHTFIHDYAFTKERNVLLNVLRSKITNGQAYCQKNSARLAEIQREGHYRVWADLLMANLHTIPPGAEKVMLKNFYAEDHPVEIRLKATLSPQKNAELFYKKAKNQHIEVERLESAIRQKKAEMEGLAEVVKDVEGASDLKTLRALKAASGEADERQEATHLPYHEFHFKGYRIWVGRNAQGNDVLTLKHSYKEDLWLHVKDVSGSHVLVKHQAGKSFPKDVIAFAASLAAYHSKRRNESLCPVVVTPKKFVRKRKGDPPGAVVVEREEVVMVEPWRIS